MQSINQFKNVSFRQKNLHDNERCYCQDTIKHLKENELRFTYPSNKLIFNADESNDENLKRYSLNTFRQRAIEWMISIQDYFTNCEETLEMATRLFDFVFYNDFYAKLKGGHYEGSVIKSHQKESRLHLAALTCYFLSCKFWERFPPKLTKLIQIADYGYTEKAFLEMEREILMKLDFDLKIPLITQYIEFYILHEKTYYIAKITTVSHYLSNLAMTDLIYAYRLPSTLAAVILTLSKLILNVFSTNNEENNGNGMVLDNLGPYGTSTRLFDIYDENLFELEDFYGILKEMWKIFISSVTSSSFKLQKKKFSEQKYSYLYPYLESIDLQRLQMHHNYLTNRVKNFLALHQDV